MVYRPITTAQAQNIDKINLCIYNVITMNSNIINIGNSKGVRIPKPLLEESGLGSKVEITAKKGEIKITAVIEPDQPINNSSILSEKSLAKEWLNKDEDKAWESL